MVETERRHAEKSHRLAIGERWRALIEGLLLGSPVHAVRLAMTEVSSPADVAAVGAQPDAVVVQIDLLHGEIAGLAKSLRTELAATLRHRAQMIELLEILEKQSTFTPEKNVSAVAQAVLAGQKRTRQT